MIKIYPTLNSLRQNLRISELNTGKQFEYRGIVFDDIEALHAIVGFDGCIHFKSGTEMSIVHYRGQPADYNVCLPSIGRYKSDKEQFLAFCRTVAFEFLLDKHPFIEAAKNITLFGDKYACINKTAIAQHYGLSTCCLDLTSNFDVASFFASCVWNNKNRKYEPVHNASYAGVIFRTYEMILFGIDMGFEYLGWQPLPRPEQQRASIVKMEKNVDFSQTAKKYYFKHSNSASKKIWKKFDEGRVLFPEDSAAELAEECKKLTNFTVLEIEEAVRRFEKFNNAVFSQETVEQLIEDNNMSITIDNALNWSNLVNTNIDFWEEKFLSVVDNVRFRLAM